MESIINDSPSDEIHIPIEELLGEEFHPKFEPILSTECCIYKVDETFRKENEGAFTPRFISIGPFHYKDPKLKPMEKQKILYFSYFRARDGVTIEALSRYKMFLEENKHMIRNCYSDKHLLTVGDEELVRMILLDSVFIMELFLRNMQYLNDVLPNGSIDDDLFDRSVLRLSIQRDLLLIENQIPFFVLEELYKLQPASKSFGFIDVARTYFDRFDRFSKLSADYVEERHFFKQGWKKPKHFTDLIRYLLIPRDLYPDEYPISIIKSATKLKLAGITFEPASRRCLLGVRFKKVPILNQLSCLCCLSKCLKPCLQIPRLKVHDSTESFLRNLMVFEQYYYPKHSYISSYVILLGYLIQTKEDVQLLVENKVILNALRSDEDLLQMLRSLTKHVVLNSYCYGRLSQRLNKHYYNVWNRGVAIIRLVYFKDASRTAATISGLIVLVFSIVSLFSALKNLNVKILS